MEKVWSCGGKFSVQVCNFKDANETRKCISTQKLDGEDTCEGEFKIMRFKFNTKIDLDLTKEFEHKMIEFSEASMATAIAMAEEESRLKNPSRFQTVRRQSFDKNDLRGLMGRLRNGSVQSVLRQMVDPEVTHNRANFTITTEIRRVFRKYMTVDELNKLFASWDPNLHPQVNEDNAEGVVNVIFDATSDQDVKSIAKHFKSLLVKNNLYFTHKVIEEVIDGSQCICIDGEFQSGSASCSAQCGNGYHPKICSKTTWCMQAGSNCKSKMDLQSTWAHSKTLTLEFFPERSCKLGEWTDWSRECVDECSATCGGGVCKRRRSCYNPITGEGMPPEECDGPQEHPTSCNTWDCYAGCQPTMANYACQEVNKNKETDRECNTDCSCGCEPCDGKEIILGLEFDGQAVQELLPHTAQVGYPAPEEHDHIRDTIRKTMNKLWEKWMEENEEYRDPKWPEKFLRLEVILKR